MLHNTAAHPCSFMPLSIWSLQGFFSLFRALAFPPLFLSFLCGLFFLSSGLSSFSSVSFRQLPQLLALYPPPVLSQRFIPLCLRLSTDPFATVRAHAAKAVSGQTGDVISKGREGAKDNWPVSGMKEGSKDFGITRCFYLWFLLPSYPRFIRLCLSRLVSSGLCFSSLSVVASAIDCSYE